MEIPDGTRIIESATAQGWEPGIAAFVVVVAVLLICSIQIIQWRREVARDKETASREDRLANRVTKLESAQEQILVGLVADTSTCLAKNTSQLEATVAAIDKLTMAADSWRRHSDESGDRMDKRLDCFGEECEKRWSQQLPAALTEHMSGEQFAKHLRGVVQAELDRAKAAAKPPAAEAS